MSNVEQTLSIIKPDAVERNLIKEIKNIFLKNNLKIKESKKYILQKMKLQNFTKFINPNHFFNDLLPLPIIWADISYDFRGRNAVTLNRQIMGATDPKNAAENTIRKLYGLSIDKNSVHGSDSLDNAKNEINFFFNS